MAKEALEVAGTLHVASADVLVYTINGHSKTVSKAPMTKILRAVCKQHAIWLLNNLGKAVLGLAGKHGEARGGGGGGSDVTAEDVACFKAVLVRLGSAVQFAQRFVIVGGAHVNLHCKSSTLRVGDLLYIYHPEDGDDENTALVALARQASLELVMRILERGKVLAAKAKEDKKKLQKKQKRVEASADAKKRRMPPSSLPRLPPLLPAVPVPPTGGANEVNE